MCMKCHQRWKIRHQTSTKKFPIFSLFQLFSYLFSFRRVHRHNVDDWKKENFSTRITFSSACTHKFFLYHFIFYAIFNVFLFLPSKLIFFFLSFQVSLSIFVYMLYLEQWNNSIYILRWRWWCCFPSLHTLRWDFSVLFINKR